MFDEEYMKLFGPKPSVDIPMVRVVDENGREIRRGYYFRWVIRQPSAFDDYTKEEDVRECVVYSKSADWNMPREAKIMEVKPPFKIEIIELEDYRQ